MSEIKKARLQFVSEADLVEEVALEASVDEAHVVEPAAKKSVLEEIVAEQSEIK